MHTNKMSTDKKPLWGKLNNTSSRQSSKKAKTNYIIPKKSNSNLDDIPEAYYEQAWIEFQAIFKKTKERLLKNKD